MWLGRHTCNGVSWLLNHATDPTIWTEQYPLFFSPSFMTLEPAGFSLIDFFFIILSPIPFLLSEVYKISICYLIPLFAAPVMLRATTSAVNFSEVISRSMCQNGRSVKRTF